MVDCKICLYLLGAAGLLQRPDPYAGAVAAFSGLGPTGKVSRIICLFSTDHIQLAFDNIVKYTITVSCKYIEHVRDVAQWNISVNKYSV